MTLTLRLATWNIHGSIGQDRTPRPERIARFIEGFRADIVVLQEVDGRERLGRQPRAFETFGALLGGHVVEARLIGRPGEEHGSLLWSRRPITRSTVHLLPGGLEQRGLIEAEIAVDGDGLRVFGTHLGLSPLTRRRQVDAILDIVGDGPGPQVLMGDLNEWRSKGAVHRRLAARLPVTLCPKTFPARRPLAGLDRIYASRTCHLTPVEVTREIASASDHLPIVADLAFRRTP